MAKARSSINGSLRSKGAVLGPVIMPMLFYGPSNQIHQAKEAIYTMLGDEPAGSKSLSGSGAFTLMLPYLLPHYSQAKVEGFTAFSEYFEISSSFVIEEQEVFGNVSVDLARDLLSKDGIRFQTSTPARLGTRNAALISHLFKNVPEKCPVYHRRGLTGRFLERCGEQVDWFIERSGGRACRDYEFIPFLGTLRDVAGVMRVADTDFALACLLERAVSTQVVINKVKSVSEYAAGKIDTETVPPYEEKVQRWFDVANVLQLKVGQNSLPGPTFTLHLRAPDPVVLRKKRKTSEDFIIGKDPKKNAVLHRSVLSNLIENKILEVEENRNVSIKTIHLMTNDLVLADYVHNHFKAQGYSVTFSPDRSLKALMNDYAIAAQSVAFYGMRKSSITTNIEHARIALLGINELTGDRFWEDIIPDANY